MKKLRTRSIALMLVFVMCFALFATSCGKKNEESPGNDVKDPEPSNTMDIIGVGDDASELDANTVKTDETLVVAHPAEPTKLTPLNGPLTHNDVAPFDAMTLSLFKINYETYEAEPYLCYDWEEIDETHYRLFLRDDATYTDGTPVTAHDVVWTFKRYAEKGVMFATYLNIDEVVAEDDYTVILAFKQHTPGWYNELTREGIYNEKMVEAAGGFDNVDRNPPSGGRYFLKEWKPGEYILLERNENYWDKDYVGYYKYIKFIFVPDTASRVMAVQSGDADVAATLTVSQIKALENDPTVDTEMIYNGTVMNMYFNNEKGIFAEHPRLREAAALAIQPEAMNQLVNMGAGKVVQGMFSPENEYYVDVYPNGVKPYDPERAKEIMAEEGFPDGFSCYSPGTADNVEILTIIQEQLRAVNIDFQFDVLDASVAGPEGRNGNYDIAIASYAHMVLRGANFEQVNPDMIGVAFSHLRTNGDEIRELIAKASSPDIETKREGWTELQEYLFNNYCLVGLCTRFDCFAMKKGLAGAHVLYLSPQYSVTDIRPVDA